MAITLSRPRPADSDTMSLAEHLRELRRRVVVVGLTLAATATVAFVFYPEILRWLQAPYCAVAHPCRLYVTGPLDGLSLRIRIATYGGVFLASPVVFWQLWRFVAPGLHRRERRPAIAFVAASVVLFSGGAALALATFPHALRFLGSVGGPTLQQIYDPNKYLGLVTALMVVFGVAFEFPVVLVALELVGVLQPATLASWRRWAIVLIVTMAAIITPSGDPFSMLALALPLYVFYELSILVGRLLRRSSAH